jgi:hypothetical protein
VPHLVYFDFDADSLDARARRDLVQIAQQIRDLDPGIKIVLVGHADPRGTPEYNVDLGQRRADSTAAYLDSLGVRVQRLTTESRGELQRVTDLNTEEAWAKDRRVEFHYCDPKDPAALRRPHCEAVLDGTPREPSTEVSDGNPTPAARDGPLPASAPNATRPTQKR